MNISKIAVLRPVTMLMGMLIVVLLGVIGVTKTPVDLFPNIEFPVAGVVTSYPGASPQAVETLVTKPLEKQLSTVANIETVTATSQENMSMVMFQFAWGTDLDRAISDLRNQLELVSGQLPEDVQDPSIIRFDPSLLPTMQIGIGAHEGLTTAELTRLVEEEVIPELQKTEGVAAVNMTGAQPAILSIALHQDQLNQHGLSKEDIVQVIQGSNVLIPAGSVEGEEGRMLAVRTQYTLDSLENIRELPVGVNAAVRPPVALTLDDVADIDIATQEVQSVFRLNGQDGVGLTITKEGSANTLAVAGAVEERIEELQEEYENLQFEVTANQASIIEQSINSVTSSGILGAIIAVVVLFLFLRNVRSTLIIAISIPFSVVATFVLMYYTNLTLNMMTLGGLLLGVGMLVDNSIVVLENIYRHIEEEGKKAKDAAIAGAKEMTGAITASTLTTVAVFLPISFAGGLAAQFFTEFALTITFSLLSSLAVALTVVPALAGVLLNTQKTQKKGKQSKHLFRKEYEQLLAWSLKHRAATLGMTAVVVIGTLALLPLLKTELLPSADSGELSIAVELETGASLSETMEVVTEVEKRVLENEAVEIVTVSAGSGDATQALLMGGGGSDSATLQVRLDTENALSDDEIVAQIESVLADLSSDSVEIAVAKSDSQAMSIGTNVQYEVSGDNFEEVQDVANALTEKMGQIEGLESVSNNLNETVDQLVVRPNPQDAFLRGLVPASVGGSLRAANTDSTIGYITIDDVVYNTTVTYATDPVTTVQDVRELQLPIQPSGTVALGDVSDVAVEPAPAALYRTNQSPAVTVSANLGAATLGEVQMKITQTIHELDIPDSVTVMAAGAGQMQEDTFRDLGLVLVLAIVLVYMVMAAQFEKLLHPFLILFSFPLALLGMLWLLLLTGTPLGMTAIIGAIVLAGIVVNNAIVLVDYTEQKQKEGMSADEALLAAGPTRLRPIFMTASTTILALIPVALEIGEGSELLAPMGISVIGGLVTSTLLTLVVIPVLYSLLEQVVAKVRNK